MYTIAFFASIIMTIKYVAYANAHIILLCLPYALILAFEYYCWDVVYSVYRDLKREENENETTMRRMHLDLSTYV